jgi:surface protein
MNIIRYGGPMARTRRVGSPIGYSGSAGGAIEAFISVWATTGVDETITIPCQNVGTFNAIIDWGDGTPTSTVTAYNDADLAHEYAAIGEHTISITGTFPNIYLNNSTEKLKIKRVTNLGTVGWTKLNQAFWGCTNLTEFTVGSTDTSGVDNMQLMFTNCSGLTSLDVSSFDISNVTSLFNTFGGCSGLISIDVSSWVTSSVATMAFMFEFCPALTSMVGVEDWAITGLDSTGSLTVFLSQGKMTTAQYDNLLVNWEAQASGIPAMTASFGASKYTGGGAAATAHASLTDVYGWSIGDGGIV